jgi:hypothetical protein
MRHIKKNIEICITSGELSERSISGLNRLPKPEVTSAHISPAYVEPESTTLHWRHDIQENDTRHNDTKHNNKHVTLSILRHYAGCSHAERRSFYCYAEVHYAECHNAECHNAECHNAECHNAECHNAECHNAECENAE